jgi:hypothetical protein
MGELLGVVINPSNFVGCFRGTFGASREMIVSKLQPVCKIRNKVFHFRDDASVEELEVLADTRRWLLRKILTLQGR